MNYHFTAHRQIRHNLLNLLQETPLEELLIIPDGFNNNMFWNIAHCVATQQLLHYYLSGNDLRIDASRWIDRYKKGTLPNFDVDEVEKEHLEHILIATSEVLVEDYDAGLFSDYKSYTTSFGLDLKNIQDAIIFNNIHEGMHLGYAMAQKRALINY